jgi:YD repeat-containing protein
MAPARNERAPDPCRDQGLDNVWINRCLAGRPTHGVGHGWPMRTLIAITILAILSTVAAAQTTFYDSRGRLTGTTSARGNVTTFRNRMGRSRHS